MPEIEALAGFDRRAAGTDAERRAATHLAGRLRSLGREVAIEPIEIWPNYAMVHFLHAVLAIAGSLISAASPVAGLALVGVATLSALGDLTGTLHLARRLTGRRASQNVHSPEKGGKPGRLLLVAHYDAARGGAFFGSRWVEGLRALGRRLRFPFGAAGGFLLAMAAILLCTVVRVAGVDSNALSAVQFVPTALLVVSLPLLVDIRLSPPSPGAADNAAGVATVLRLAERFGDQLEYFDLDVLLTGAEESMGLGMRAWLREHRRELPKDRTLVINVDKVGSGTIRFTAREGMVLPGRSDPALTEICRDIAASDRDTRFGAREVVARGTSDAVAARSRGYRAITVSCVQDDLPHHDGPSDTPSLIDEEALERAFAFCSVLLDRADQELGPAIEDAVLAEAAR